MSAAATRCTGHWIIIGAGWSGLACAVEAAQHAYSVTLIDAAPNIGGRARRVQLRIGDAQFAVDNGQHLLVGACQETLGLMRRLGVCIDEVLREQPFTIRYPDGWRLAAARAPAPLHLAVGLALAHGIPWRQRLALGTWVAQRSRQDWQLPEDLTLAQLLREQPQDLQRRLWRPLCIAVMNAEPEQISARLFLNVLRLTLGAAEPDSRLLLTRRDLSSTLPEAALQYLQQHGATIHLRQPALGLARCERGWQVTLRDRTLAADRVVVAVPAESAVRLLESAALPALQPDIARLQRLQYQPIATVYLRYPAQVALPAPIYALLDDAQQGRPGQWVFDRGQIDASHRGTFSVLIGAPALREQADRAQLCQAADRQLQQEFGLPPSLAQNIVIERRATLLAEVDLQRPAARLPAEGLYLAGDVADSPFPSTLEGSVRAGLQAARCALADANA